MTSGLYHRSLYPWVMATVEKGLSDRQKHHIRASIAKRLVECDTESLWKTSAPSMVNSQTVTGCENDPCMDYKSEDDDHLLPSSDPVMAVTSQALKMTDPVMAVTSQALKMTVQLVLTLKVLILWLCSVNPVITSPLLMIVPIS